MGSDLRHSMRAGALGALIGLLFVTRPAAAGDGVRLTVRVLGLRNDRGSVFCEMFSGPKGYPTDAKLAAQKTTVPIQDRSATCIFEGLAPGAYAVAAYHDENGNKRLDTNFLGIPTEGTAASNDARGSLGPPSFEKAQVAVGATDLTIAMHIAY